MTSTPVSNLAQANTPEVLLSKTGKLWLAILGVLFTGFHWHMIQYSFRTALRDQDWSHILIIPFISLYYIHLNRKQIMATPRRVCIWGLPLIVLGMVGYVLGIYPIRNGMAMGYSMILTLFGIALLLLGPTMLRRLWFPILFLVFAVKVSDAIWSIVASKMQTIAAYGAVILLDLTSGISGMHAELRGSTIDLDYFFNGQHMIEPMNVAEACAGMRMLMAFLALGVALAFLFSRLWWQRAAMIVLAAPIAILVNAVRVAVLGWLHLIDKELAHGDFHIFVGMLMLLPAAGLLMLVGWCLDKVVIVEGDRKAPPPPLPFDRDPAQLHLQRGQMIKGALTGAGVVVFLGLGYILYINRQTGGDVIQWLSAGLSTGLLLVSGVLFLLGLTASWWLIQRGERTGQVTLCQSIIGGLLLAATLGQHAAISSMEIALSKKPLPLRHGIALSFPEQAGDWVLLHQDPRLSKDVEGELGTKQYFNRWYLNTAEVDRDTVTLETKPTKLGDMLSGWNGIDGPGQIAKVHVTYYTGMLDAVPHVPDKCWVVAGSQVRYRDVHMLKLAREDYRPDPDHDGLLLAESTGFKETVRLPGDKIETVVFSASNPKGNVNTALYFFLANGNAVASNHNVRFSFNLKDRYSYYCKVEVMFPGVNDPDQVAKYAEGLITDLLPEIMAALPDWTEVRAGTYPDKNAGQ